MNDVINHKTGTCIWYHSAPVERVKNILREGLKINSKPTWQANPEPWIYVSTEPWNSDSNVVFEVDLSFLNTDEAGWPFGQDEEPLENRWQLRVFKDIPSSFIKPMNPDYIKGGAGENDEYAKEKEKVIRNIKNSQQVNSQGCNKTPQAKRYFRRGRNVFKKRIPATR